MGFFKNKMRDGLFGRLVRIGVHPTLAAQLAAASHPDSSQGMPSQPTQVSTTSVHDYLEAFLRSRERFSGQSLSDREGQVELEGLWATLWGISMEEYFGIEDARDEEAHPFRQAVEVLMEHSYAIESLPDDDKKLAGAALMTAAEVGKDLTNSVMLILRRKMSGTGYSKRFTQEISRAWFWQCGQSLGFMSSTS